MNIIDVIDRKFLCQHRNGDTFATNPTTDYVSYMQGEVLEKLKLVAQYEVSTVTEASTTVLITATDTGSQIKIHHPYNDWITEGFVVGNTVRIEANGNNTTETVEAIQGQNMYLSDTSFISTLGVVSGVSRDDYVFRVTTVPDEVQFAFGIVPNNQANPSFASLLNGETQLYVGTGLVLSTPETLTYLANQATDLGSVTVEYTGASGTGNSVFSFTVEHIFRVPHFIEDWQFNYQTESIPAAFQGISSFKYVSVLNLSNNINDPNTIKQVIDDFQLGSIGFVGQNFNNGITDYSLESNSITVSGSTVTFPEITQANTFATTINRSSASFAAGLKVYLYVSKLPTKTEYTDSSGSYEENFVIDTLDVLEGAGTSTSSIIRNFQANINGGDPQMLDLAFDLDWSLFNEDDFEGGEDVFVGVIMEDETLNAPVSDRMLVQIYSGAVTKNLDVTSLISQNQIDFYNASADAALAAPTSNIDTWNNRAYIADGYFRTLKEADSNNGQVSSLKFQVVGYKTSDNTFFKISEYNFPLGNGKIPGTIVNVGGTGYQSLGVSTNRPIGNVPSSSELAKVEFISTIPGVYQNYQEYNWQLGFEVPHREWVYAASVNSVAPEFYDGGLPDEFYGFNERTSNYSGANSFEIYVFATAVVSWDGTLTTYHMTSDQCEVADFDVDVIGTGWSADTKLYDSNDIEIDVMYVGEDIRIEVTFTRPSGTLSSPAGEIVIEPTLGTGLTNRLSTDKDWSGSNNMLKGLSGAPEYVTLTTPDLTTTVLECLIKGDKLQDGQEYNIYGHLFNGR